MPLIIQYKNVAQKWNTLSNIKDLAKQTWPQNIFRESGLEISTFITLIFHWHYIVNSFMCCCSVMFFVMLSGEHFLSSS